MHDALMNSYINTQEPYISEFTVTTLDSEERELFKFHYKDLIPISMSDLRLAQQDKNESFNPYTVTFMFNKLDIEFIPRYREDSEEGILIEDFYDRLIVNDPNNDPTTTYPNSIGCETKCDDDTTTTNELDELFPVIKKPKN